MDFEDHYLIMDRLEITRMLATARYTIRGYYGNGEARIRAYQRLGFSPEQIDYIQATVNYMMKLGVR